MKAYGAASPRVADKYVAELCAGCGIFARALREMGFSSREWERLHGEISDSTRPCVIRHIEQEASLGCIISAMLAPP